MSSTASAVPTCLHREQRPIRTCDGCGAYLSTGNETETCWACEPSWKDDTASQLGRAMREEIGEAFDRVLVAA